VSLNLISGVTGSLSLGHHGFMLIGGYVTGLLMLPEAARQNLQFSARNSLSDFALGRSVERWMEALGLGFLATPETLGVRFVVALVLGGLLRSEEHTSELQSRENLVCRLLLEKKNIQTYDSK